MKRFSARGGILALALVVGATIAAPVGSAAQVKSPPRDALVNATSWGLISIAQPSPSNAMIVGYSKLPSTEPIGMQWNGTSWTSTPMPHPSGGALLYTVTAVPRTDDYLAGGEICTSKACPGAYILEWNGTAWSQMALPHLADATDIASISASSATDAWAVGQQCDDVNGNCNPLFLHWNGKVWSAVKVSKINGLFADIYSVVDISPFDVWAVGESYLGAVSLNWNGHAWVNVGTPGAGGFDTGLNAAASIPGTSELWALEAASGGQFLLKWNGTSWHGFGLPIRGYFNLFGVSASSTSNAWVVGSAFSASGTEPSITAHYDGRRWSKVKSPNPSPDNELFSVATTSGSNAWAAGVSFSPLQQTAAGLLLEYHGTTWSRVKAPIPKVPSDPTPDAKRMTQSDRF